MEYKEIYENKRNFAAEHLKPFIMAADPGIVNVTYYCIDGVGEYIDLCYQNGRTATIDVTADSIKAMCADVVRYILIH